MTGIALRTLRLSLEIGGSTLARELGVTPQTVQSAEVAGKLEPKTEAKYVAALGTIARRLAAERRRSKTEELLAIVAD